MASPIILIESLIERVESFGKTTIELSKLKALEASTRITSSLVARLTVIIIFSLFMLILSIGIAIFLGELLGKVYYGFLIVALFYFIAGILFHFFLQKWIKNPVSKLIIKQVLQKSD